MPYEANHPHTARPAAMLPRPVIFAAAALAALGAVPLAGVVLAGAVVVHAARSPDRLLDLAFAIAFCGLGALVGR